MDAWRCSVAQRAEQGPTLILTLAPLTPVDAIGIAPRDDGSVSSKRSRTRALLVTIFASIHSACTSALFDYRPPQAWKPAASLRDIAGAPIIHTMRTYG